jgi:F1F0 ATPase subunit 2
MTKDDNLVSSIRQRTERRRRAQREGEPSFGRYLAQVGVLGWTIVLPAPGHRHFLDRSTVGDWSSSRLLGRMAMDARAMTFALWLLAGLAGGTAHFVLLRWNTRLYVSGELAPAIGAQALRLAAIVSLLVFAALHGALPLLLAALGVILARPVVLQVLP